MLLQTKALRLPIAASKLLYTLLRRNDRSLALFGVLLANAMNVGFPWEDRAAKTRKVDPERRSYGDLLYPVWLLIEYSGLDVWRDKKAFCQAKGVNKDYLKKLRRNTLTTITLLNRASLPLPNDEPRDFKDLKMNPDVVDQLKQYIGDCLKELQVVKRLKDDRVCDQHGIMGRIHYKSLVLKDPAPFFAFSSSYVAVTTDRGGKKTTVTYYTGLTPLQSTKDLEERFASLVLKERVYNQLTPHLREVLLAHNLGMLQMLQGELGLALELDPDPTILKVCCFVMPLLPT